MRGSILLLSLPALLTIADPIAQPTGEPFVNEFGPRPIAMPEWGAGAHRRSDYSRALEPVLNGAVTDASTQRPIVGAQVMVETARRGAVTDERGTYRLRIPDTLVGDSIRLSVHSIGYERADTVVLLRDGEQVVNVRMRQTVIQLDEVVVTGSSAVAIRGAAHASVATVMTPRSMPAGRFNTESYAYIDENGFASPDAAPLSTFSVDVDRASFANVRRFIEDHRLPPVDAVRVEELINYFPYADPEPSSRDPFAITTTVAPAPWQPAHRLVRIGLQAKRVDLRDLPPNNLVFLIDVSGSMTPASKLPLLKQSLALLVHEMRPQDRIALVVYAGAAGLVLEPTSGSDKKTILAAIERLHAGGSTAGGAGIRLAYDIAREHFLNEGNNRVILATDGDFNVGASSDAEMIRLIEERRAEGTYLTVLGFGTGNLKDSKMEALADHGNGNYAYIDDLLEARKALVTELGGTLLTVASDVKIQVEFNPALVAGYRLVGYENRLLDAEDFADDTKDAGEIGAGHAVTALYEVVPRNAASSMSVPDGLPLRYQASRERHDSDELMYVSIRYKRPGQSSSRLIGTAVRSVDSADAGPDFHFAAAVAAWGMILRDSPHRGNADLDMVARLGFSGLGDDPGGYRAQFLRLVEASRPLVARRIADASR